MIGGFVRAEHTSGCIDVNFIDHGEERVRKEHFWRGWDEGDKRERGRERQDAMEREKEGVGKIFDRVGSEMNIG